MAGVGPTFPRRFARPVQPPTTWTVLHSFSSLLRHQSKRTMEDAAVSERARHFEQLIRSQLEFSFSKNYPPSRRGSAGSSIELMDLTAGPSRTSSGGGGARGGGFETDATLQRADSERGPSELSRTISPLSRMSSRRGEEALNSLITETSRLMSLPPQGSSQADLVAAMSQRLADIAHALSSKEDEVQNLQAVMKELAETRAEAIQLKVNCLESFNKLQAEYGRVIKAARRAQETSRYNLSKAFLTRNSLRDTQDALHREKAVGASLQRHNRQLQAQNRELQERLAALEAGLAGQQVDCRHSLSLQVYKEMSLLRNVGLY